MQEKNMEKATADCVCFACGRIFEKCVNAEDRQKTEAMEELVCPECRWKKLHTSEYVAGLIAEVQLDYAAAAKGRAEAVIVVTGCGFLYREQLKSLGYLYTIHVPSQRMWNGMPAIRLYTRKKLWAKRIALDYIEPASSEIVALGGKCIAPEDKEMQEYARFLAECAQRETSEAGVNA